MLNFLVRCARIARNAALLAVIAALLVRDAFVDPRREADLLGSARSWAYQLQRIDLEALAGSRYDAVVVDIVLSARGLRHFTRSDTRRLAEKPDGGRRVVLAYVSIGEAESYRPYWQRAWATSPPAWLGKENPRWRRNFAVRFWDPDWQRLIVDGPDSLVDRALAAGFDGVYLDRVDVYGDWLAERPTARADMIAFVHAIALHARARRPGFKIMVQNGEELLDDARYLALIDGIAKEDLLFGEQNEEEANAEDEVAYSIAQLDKAKRAGKPVWVVEYLSLPEQRAQAGRRLSQLGYIATFAVRALDRIEGVERSTAPARPGQSP